MRLAFYTKSRMRRYPILERSFIQKFGSTTASMPGPASCGTRLPSFQPRGRILGLVPPAANLWKDSLGHVGSVELIGMLPLNQSPLPSPIETASPHSRFTSRIRRGSPLRHHGTSFNHLYFDYCRWMRVSTKVYTRRPYTIFAVDAGHASHSLFGSQETKRRDPQRCGCRRQACQCYSRHDSYPRCSGKHK